MSRRLEKINRTILETVSTVIQNQLSDPRIQGLTSVTRVQTAADLSCARVYLSILGAELKQQELTLQAIQHAAGFIQGRLAQVLTTRICPSLTFFLDDSLKKGFEVSRLLDEIKAQTEPAEEIITETPSERPSGDCG
ncbi:MAG: 30S ribosome-binding factor RbfA [Sedimentisphaerales bacterium]|nr:30S ribosome-binding factor RbfA [Sedimentisphaerales bacterium]